MPASPVALPRNMATPPGARSSAEFSAVIDSARVAPNPNPRTMTTAVSTHGIGSGARREACARPRLGDGGNVLGDWVVSDVIVVSSPLASTVDACSLSGP